MLQPLAGVTSLYVNLLFIFAQETRLFIFAYTLETPVNQFKGK